MSQRELGCEEVIAYLFDYLDGELETEQAENIERRLARCRECFTRTDFEQRLRERVAASGSVTTPPRLQRRIRHLLDGFDEDDPKATH